MGDTLDGAFDNMMNYGTYMPSRMNGGSYFTAEEAIVDIYKYGRATINSRRMDVLDSEFRKLCDMVKERNSTIEDIHEQMILTKAYDDFNNYRSWYHHNPIYDYSISACTYKEMLYSNMDTEVGWVTSVLCGEIDVNELKDAVFRKHAWKYDYIGL